MSEWADAEGRAVSVLVGGDDDLLLDHDGPIGLSLFEPDVFRFLGHLHFDLHFLSAAYEVHLATRNGEDRVPLEFRIVKGLDDDLDVSPGPADKPSRSMALNMAWAPWGFGAVTRPRVKPIMVKAAAIKRLAFFSMAARSSSVR